MKKEKNQDKNISSKNPFIAIPTNIAGIVLVIVIIMSIFTPGNIAFMVSIVWALVVLGAVALLVAAYIARK